MNMDNREIQIGNLREQIAKLDDKEKFDLEAWKSKTIIILEGIPGENNKYIIQIENIKYESLLVSTVVTTPGPHEFRDNLENCKKRCREILELAIAEFERLQKEEEKRYQQKGDMRQYG